MNTLLNAALLLSCLWLMTACINHYLNHPRNLLKRMMLIFIFPTFLIQTILGILAFLLPGDALVMEPLWYISLSIYITLNCLFAFTSFLTRNKVLRPMMKST